MGDIGNCEAFKRGMGLPDSCFTKSIAGKLENGSRENKGKILLSINKAMNQGDCHSSTSELMRANLWTDYEVTKRVNTHTHTHNLKTRCHETGG